MIAIILLFISLTLSNIHGQQIPPRPLAGQLQGPSHEPFRETDFPSPRLLGSAGGHLSQLSNGAFQEYPSTLKSFPQLITKPESSNFDESSSHFNRVPKMPLTSLLGSNLKLNPCFSLSGKQAHDLQENKEEIPQSQSISNFIIESQRSHNLFQASELLQASQNSLLSRLLQSSEIPSQNLHLTPRISEILKAHFPRTDTFSSLTPNAEAPVTSSPLTSQIPSPMTSSSLQSPRAIPSPLTLTDSIPLQDDALSLLDLPETILKSPIGCLDLTVTPFGTISETPLPDPSVPIPRSPFFPVSSPVSALAPPMSPLLPSASLANRGTNFLRKVPVPPPFI